jgi:hypothetical protein
MSNVETLTSKLPYLFRLSECCNRFRGLTVQVIRWNSPTTVRIKELTRVVLRLNLSQVSVSEVSLGSTYAIWSRPEGLLRHPNTQRRDPGHPRPDNTSAGTLFLIRHDLFLIICCPALQSY